MLIDLHAHSAGISRCCKITFEANLQRALDHGMDGVVLTNHYQKSYIPDGGLTDFVERYIDEYFAAKAFGDTIGCKVYFVIEVTMERYPNVHMLIYGVDPDFLRKYPTVFDCTQRELYELVKANSGILVQAHPYRNGTTVLDVDLLDGVEINCHALYHHSYAQKLQDIAKAHDLIVTCGADYHADSYRPKCGMYIPEEIEDHHDLCDYLRSKEAKTLCIQEPDTDEAFTLYVK